MDNKVMRLRIKDFGETKDFPIVDRIGFSDIDVALWYFMGWDEWYDFPVILELMD
jgi:hypothetical protein